MIGQVYKKATFMDVINNYLRTIKQEYAFKELENTYTNQIFFRVDSVKKAASHWMEYAEKRKKLKRILKGSQVEPYIMNRIERVKATRSKGVG